MRTTAEATPSRATPARETPAARRRRSASAPAPAPQTPAQPSISEAAEVAVASVRILRVDEGFYALRVGELLGTAGRIAGMALPAAHVSAPFAEDGNGVEIVASFPRRGPWLGREGGTAILRAPRGGGHVIVTLYGSPGQPAADLSLDLRRIDDVGVASPIAARPSGAPAGAAVPAEGRDIPTEVMLHLERAGDRLFPGRGWVGALGRQVRIEAFSIRPLEALAPADIEMKAFVPNGGETAWVPGGALCGTRGQGLPLVGFAVRVVPQLADRFAVQYQGSFFAAGISDLRQDGEPCRAATGEDPLEAINIRLIERGAGSEGGAAGS